MLVMVVSMYVCMYYGNVGKTQARVIPMSRRTLRCMSPGHGDSKTTFVWTPDDKHSTPDCLRTFLDSKDNHQIYFPQRRHCLQSLWMVIGHYEIL